MAGQLKVNGVTLATEESGTVTLEAPQIKDSSNNVILDQSGTNPVLKNVEVVNNSSMMFRNRIINGDMKIAQRGTSFSFAHDGTTNGFTLDRFNAYLHNTDEYDCTVSQYSMTSSEVNTTGHSSALKFLTGTPEISVGNVEYVRVTTKIEGQDQQDLQQGTSLAKQMTLSFWVKSSITGTFGFNLYRYVSSGTSRIINLSYTINSADTWEYKTIQITGDTGGSLIPNNNSAGFLLIWQLGAGFDTNSTAATSWGDYASTRLMGNHSNEVATTAGADWYLTGVQLEVGNQATPFEHRPYGAELALCQRYCQKLRRFDICKMRESDRFSIGTYQFVTEMRAAPTIPARIQEPDNLSVSVGEIDTLGFTCSFTRPGDGYGGTVSSGGVAAAEL